MNSEASDRTNEGSVNDQDLAKQHSVIPASNSLSTQSNNHVVHNIETEEVNHAVQFCEQLNSSIEVNADVENTPAVQCSEYIETPSGEKIVMDGESELNDVLLASCFAMRDNAVWRAMEDLDKTRISGNANEDPDNTLSKQILEAFSESSDDEDDSDNLTDECETDEPCQKSITEPAASAESEDLHDSIKPPANFPDTMTNGFGGLEPVKPESIAKTFADDIGLVQIGKIMSKVEKLVVIEAIKGSRPLDVGNIIGLENRQVIGLIADTFGPIQSPYYAICIQDDQDSDLVEIGAPVFTDLSSCTFLVDDNQTPASFLKGRFDSETTSDTDSDYDTDKQTSQQKEAEKTTKLKSKCAVNKSKRLRSTPIKSEFNDNANQTSKSYSPNPLRPKNKQKMNEFKKKFAFVRPKALPFTHYVGRGAPQPFHGAYASQGHQTNFQHPNLPPPPNFNTLTNHCQDLSLTSYANFAYQNFAGGYPGQMNCNAKFRPAYQGNTYAPQVGQPLIDMIPRPPVPFNPVWLQPTEKRECGWTNMGYPVYHEMFPDVDQQQIKSWEYQKWGSPDDRYPPSMSTPDVGAAYNPNMVHNEYLFPNYQKYGDGSQASPNQMLMAPHTLLQDPYSQ